MSHSKNLPVIRIPTTPISQDEYLMRCDHCQRVTVWKLCAAVAHIAWYRCQTCGAVRR